MTKKNFMNGKREQIENGLNQFAILMVNQYFLLTLKRSNLNSLLEVETIQYLSNKR